MQLPNDPTRYPASVPPTMPPAAAPVAATPAVVPVVPAAPAQVAPAQVAPAAPAAPAEEPQEEGREEVVIVSHSPLLYWWPVWFVGFAMAALTYFEGRVVEVGENHVWFHPSTNLGVIFLLTLLMVIVITNVSVRGWASAVVIVSIAFLTVLLAYFGLWDAVLGWFDQLKIAINLGTYIWFSTAMFLIWALSVFFFDRFTYWRIRPGQITQEFVMGAAAKSYDTENLVLEKHRDDFFRHWILGLGSGDLLLRPYGAQREEIHIRNVLFMGSKVLAIQNLIAEQPAKFARSTIR